MSALTEAPAWQALAAHRRELAATHLRDLFAQDPARAGGFSAQAAGIHLDYSAQRINSRTMELLFKLARTCEVEQGIAAMFAGEPLNTTESRAALHVALRNFSDAGAVDWPLQVDDRPVMPEVAETLARLTAFCVAIHGGKQRGYSERRFTDVVNLGIGGSDLGPRLVCEALKPQSKLAKSALRVHFVANVDPVTLDSLLATLKPESTLFLITSKTFTTAETMANARSARAWLRRAAGEDVALSQHFAAVSTNRDAAVEFGIAHENIFGFWDWVGGRFSLWSSVGLPIALALGVDNFHALLRGAHAMDQHFRAAPLAENLPVLLALLGIWNINFLGLSTQVIAPYCQRLERLVDYLQQLEMESNGKSVDRTGQPVDYATAPVVWGSVGTNAQHAFFQSLHQGTAIHPVDFVLPLGDLRDDNNQASDDDRQRQLVANCLAQVKALMRGKSAAEVRAELSAGGLSGVDLDAAVPHRVFPGNRPSNLLLFPELNAETLGALLALYEHKVFVQGLIWNICSFDQWGVELGKQLAGRIRPLLERRRVGPADYRDLLTDVQRLS